MGTVVPSAQFTKQQDCGSGGSSGSGARSGARWARREPLGKEGATAGGGLAAACRRSVPPSPACAASQGLWRGTVPGQLLTVPYTAVQFVTLQHCRQLARQYGLHERPRWRSAVPFVSGAVAGAAATMASYPFDLLRTTLAAQGEPPVYATMTDAGEWEAYRSFVLGMSAAKPVPACQFGAVAARAPRPQPLTPSLAATPCPIGAARGIVRQHGVRGLYRGLGVTVLEIMPYAALQFGLYDVFNAAYNRTRVRFMALFAVFMYSSDRPVPLHCCQAPTASTADSAPATALRHSGGCLPLRPPHHSFPCRRGWTLRTRTTPPPVCRPLCAGWRRACWPSWAPTRWMSPRSGSRWRGCSARRVMARCVAGAAGATS